MVGEVHVNPLPPERFAEVLSGEQFSRFQEVIERGRDLLGGRVVWTVNSTARGGGVAELLTSLVAYVRGAGIDARWMVIGGDPDFFRVTKRIHNRLHGFEGDGGPLGRTEIDVYRRTLERNAQELEPLVRAGDFVLLHDPQTAGLAEPLREQGATAVWRCHVGLDEPNDFARGAWDFLRPFVEPADAYVFSRRSFVWDDLDEARLAIIAPSIDAFSAKNAELPPEVVGAVLRAGGIQSDGAGGHPSFVRADGSPGRVDRRVEAVQARPLRPSDRVVAQISRWDRLKDPIGVMRGFAEHVAGVEDAQLVLAGPSTAAVADDPEGVEVLAATIEARERLDPEVRDRVHLLSLPMEDAEENATLVNALQRRADVLAQKSLAEGFGLTVSEGMWKGRPVIGSRVGGIQDQIVDGETGVLVDPGDSDAFGEVAAQLVRDPERAGELGRAARERVRDEFLGPRSLTQYLELFRRLVPGAANG
ncbi:MAG: glycosyltransferase [Actinobacteria bacterium]|nr:glycosyltransferase [Actinomycetota bacterium]